MTGVIPSARIGGPREAVFRKGAARRVVTQSAYAPCLLRETGRVFDFSGEGAGASPARRKAMADD